MSSSHTQLRIQLDEASTELERAKEERRAAKETQETQNSTLQLQLKETQGEVQALEKQLGAAELRAAVATLYNTLHNSWMVAVGDAIRRWAALPRPEEEVAAFPSSTFSAVTHAQRQDRSPFDCSTRPTRRIAAGKGVQPTPV